MDTNKKIWLGVAVFGTAIALLFFLIWWKYSAQGLWTVIKYFLIGLTVLTIIVLIIIGIIILFRKKRVDMIEINKNAILSSALQTSPTTMKRLMFRGSKELEGYDIGYIKGFCRIKSEAVHNINESTKLKEVVFPEQDITFIVYKHLKSGLGAWFERYKIFCGLGELRDKENKVIQTSDYTELNADIVYLNGTMFTPSMFGFLYLSKHYKKTWMIDESVKESIYRMLSQENLSELKEVIDDALAIGDKYKTEREFSMAKSMGLINQQKGNTGDKS